MLRCGLASERTGGEGEGKKNVISHSTIIVIGNYWKESQMDYKSVLVEVQAIMQ